MARKSEKELTDLVEQVLVDAYGDDEELSAFEQGIEDAVTMPADAFVMGEPVSVLEIDYENERRGLTARCRCEDGSEYTIAACDVHFPEHTKAADYMAAYRLWLGMEPYPRISIRKKPKALPDELDMSKNIDLIALAVKSNSISSRILGTEHVLTLRPVRFWRSYQERFSLLYRTGNGVMQAISIFPARSKLHGLTYPP